MNDLKKSRYAFAILIIGFLFFVLGFAIGINTYLIPFLRKAFDLSIAASYLVMAATFSSVVIFGIPSGIIIKKIGYKGGIVLAFVIMATGMLLFVPSAITKSFPFFLLALFVSGVGQVLLQTSINPYITILGPQESAATRICIMGICNKVAYALGPIILSAFMSLHDINIREIIVPFFIIAGIFFTGAIISLFTSLPDIQAPLSKKEQDSETIQDSIYKYPHLFLGTIAVFFYIGVETLSLGSVLDYASQLNLPELKFLNINLQVPELFVTYATLSMIVGYLLGIMLVPKKISQQKALVINCIFGIAITIMVIQSPSNWSVWMVAALGLANAIMWPVIWPLSLAGLGDLTKTGSSILIIGLVGGVVIPLLFGWMVEILSFQMAYSICLPCYLYILFFAVKGHKMRIKTKNTVLSH